MFGPAFVDRVPFRYVWPADLDLTARLAGMRLRDPAGGVDAGAAHQRKPPARLGLENP